MNASRPYHLALGLAAMTAVHAGASAPALAQCASADLFAPASYAWAGGEFGHAVALSGNCAVIGAPENNDVGWAYIFRFDGSTWGLEHYWGGGVVDDEYGWSVAISDDTVVAGIPKSDDADPESPDCNSGSGRVWRYYSSTWHSEDLLLPDDYLFGRGSQFGFSVAVCGEVALVGAVYDDELGIAAGSAYVFRRNDRGTPIPNDDFWFQEQKLLPDDDADVEADWFGWSVAISGDVIVVGAPGDDTAAAYAGAAYVFRRNGSTWQPEAKLLPAGQHSLEWGLFGYSVALSGNDLVIGAPWDGENGADSGVAYAFVYGLEGSQWAWRLKQRLRANSPTADDWFGYSAAINEAADLVVIGAIGESAAYVFHEQVNPQTPWAPGATLLGPEGPGNGFGWSVAASGNIPLVGAPYGDGEIALSGAAHVIDLAGPDCNGNGVCDWRDIADGTSQDCNNNGTPDDCEPDCNGNGIPDDCDIRDGTSEDCQPNGIPDECDLADGTSNDADGNGVPDECDPPPNDDGDSAQSVGDVQDLPFDTTFATHDGSGTCMSGSNIWYRYTVSRLGSTFIRLKGDYDTKLAVYDGWTCDPLGSELCCNNGEGHSSVCQIDGVSFGDQFLIEVGGVGSAAGPGLLSICSGIPLPADWDDDFDIYESGSGLHGQGGWEGWEGDESGDADVTDEASQSPPNSLLVLGDVDIVHAFSECTSGQWTFTAWQYVPGSFSGESYFILLNTYGAGIHNWSTQLRFNSDLGLVVSDWDDAHLPLITDEWVELRVEIDLDEDRQAIFYGSELLVEKSWTDGLSGDGALNIGAVDLYAGGSSPVYYDDLSLDGSGEFPPPPTGACCLSDASCMDLTEEECLVQGGTYHGEDTACAWTDCPPPTGACCLSDGSCADLAQDDCTSAGGNWYPGENCAYFECPCPGDLDGDRDIDLADLAVLLSYYGTTDGAGPEDGDLDGDADVDLTDLATLLALYGTICP